MALFILLLSLFVMPGPVRGAVSAGILPYSLSTKFSESHAVQAIVNEYHDGSSQRHALVSEGRRTWNLSKHLTAAQLTQLRSFAASLQGGAFYFYNPQETLPPFSNNPIGTSGQYLVRFNGDWSQTNGMVRSDSEVQLIELTTQSEDIPVVTIGGSGGLPGSGGGGGGGGGGTPRLRLIPIDPINYAGSNDASAVFDYYRNYGPISYGGWMWAFTLTNDDEDGRGDLKLGVYKSLTGETWIRQDLANAPEFEIDPAYPYWDGVSSVVTIMVVRGESSDPFTETAVEFVDFDMSTGLFGSPYGPLDIRIAPTGATSPIPIVRPVHAYVFKLSSGTLRVVYQYFYEDVFVDHGTGEPSGGSQSQVYYQDYAGSAWAARQILSGQTVAWGTGYFLSAAVQDGDVIHAVYTPVGYYWNEAYYVRINADGTFSTPQALSPILSPDGSTYFLINTAIISGNNLLIPVSSPYGVSGAVGVLVGAPKSNPTFTYVEIATDAGFATPQMYHMATQDVFAWSQVSPTTGNLSQVYMSTSSDGGNTWSLPTLALDLDVTIPPLAPEGTDVSPRDINSISLGTNLDGSVGLMFTTWGTYYKFGS
jgi:hypothetical protein